MNLQGVEIEAAVDLRWHAVHTNARAEWLAKSRLEEQAYAVFYPHFLGTVRHARKVIGVIKPYFPRYLFVGVRPDQSLYAVNKTMGVSTVVYIGDVPLEVPGPVMAELRSRGDEDGRVAMEEGRRKARPAVGSRVSLAGPLEGFVAQVAEIDGGDHVRVWVQMFGRLVEARVSDADLSPIASG